jgi:hypothetical protein
VLALAVSGPCLAEGRSADLANLFRIFVAGLQCEVAGFTWTEGDLGRLETKYLDRFDAPLVTKREAWRAALLNAKGTKVDSDVCVATMVEFQELPPVDSTGGQERTPSM